jgi:hypothetical protein
MPTNSTIPTPTARTYQADENTHVHQTESLGAALSDVKKGLKNTAGILGKMLFNTANNSSTPNEAAKTETAPLTESILESEATTGSSPESNSSSQAETWLINQCQELSEAIITHGTQSLENLFSAAQVFKTSISDNYFDPINPQTHFDHLAETLPDDLKADLKDNLHLIQNYFNSDQRNISSKELKFLNNYIKFLGLCFSGKNQNVGQALAELSDNLNDVILKIERKTNALKEAESNSKQLLTEAITALDDLTTQENEIRERLNRPYTPSERSRIGNELGPQLDDVITQRTAQEATCAELKKTFEEAQNNLRNFTMSPKEKDILKYSEDIEFHTERAFAIQEYLWINTSLSSDNKTSLEAEMDEHISYAEVLHADLENLESSNPSPIPTDSIPISLINKNRDIQLRQRISSGSRILSHLHTFSQQQFKDIVSLTQITKNPNSNWLNFAQHFNEQSDKVELALQALSTAGASTTDNNIEISLPDHFDINLRPGGQSFSTERVAHAASDREISIYEHACKIVGENSPEVSIYQKSLANQVIGSFCLEQSFAQGSRIRPEEQAAFQQAAQVKENSSLLLACSLFFTQIAHHLPSSNPDEIQVIKNEMINYAKKFALDELAHELTSTPDSIEPGALTAIFRNGFNIAVFDRISEQSTNPINLIRDTNTNRTYENDLTVATGLSRQHVFKEAMLSASSILISEPRNTDVANGNNSNRLYNMVRNDTKLNDKLQPDRQPELLGLLGLNSDAPTLTSSILLDQLVKASIAYNDVATQENFTPRGSLSSRIERYEKNPTRESLKNHNLHHFNILGDNFIKIANSIRPEVINNINRITLDLEHNTRVIPKLEIQNLVKQIIITTDAQSTLHESFNAIELSLAAEKLLSSNTPENRAAFTQQLQNVQTAWDSSTSKLQPGQSPELKWTTADERPVIDRILKANPIKSLPFLNQTPVLGRLAATAFNLAKILIAGSIGAAAGGVILGAGALAVASVIGLALISIPAIGMYKGIQKTM